MGVLVLRLRLIQLQQVAVWVVKEQHDPSPLGRFPIHEWRDKFNAFSLEILVSRLNVLDIEAEVCRRHMVQWVTPDGALRIEPLTA